MTAKEAAECMKRGAWVKWYDAVHNTFIYGKYIETLNIFRGRHLWELGQGPRLITSARIRVNDNCKITCELKDLYPYYVDDDEIRAQLQSRIEQISRAQRSGVYIKCPRCGRTLGEGIDESHPSLRDPRLTVCGACADAEAFCDDHNYGDPVTDWWCFCTEDETI